jgi:hypothetical protein
MRAAAGGACVPAPTHAFGPPGPPEPPGVTGPPGIPGLPEPAPEGSPPAGSPGSPITPLHPAHTTAVTAMDTNPEPVRNRGLVIVAGASTGPIGTVQTSPARA